MYKTSSTNSSSLIKYTLSQRLSVTKYVHWLVSQEDNVRNINDSLKYILVLQQDQVKAWIILFIEFSLWFIVLFGTEYRRDAYEWRDAQREK